MKATTARRFIKDAEKSSEITGLDLGLVRRFCSILSARTSGLEINVMAFGQYAWETAQSVPIILIHRADVMVLRYAILLISIYSFKYSSYKIKIWLNT